ncbi:MAG: hypothetical protein WCP74_04175 [Sphingobacteriia bacterium]|jgi:hypothetical protein
MKNFNTITKSILIFLFSTILSCKKENNELDIPKDELIKQIANSSYFKEFIIVSKKQVKILNQNPSFQQRIEFILEQKNTDLLTITEKEIQQNFLTQKADILAISKKWVNFNTITKSDFNDMINLANGINNNSNEPKSMSCNSVRNAEVNQCFRDFVWDIAECWNIFHMPGPGCYYHAIKDQYRCNRDAEAHYQECIHH